MTESTENVQDCNHISQLGCYHFSVVRWFERQRAIYPDLRDLAVGCAIAVSHVERLVADEGTSYEVLRQIVESWETSPATPVMPRKTFSRFVKSFGTDRKVANYRGTRPLMWEFGPAGKMRLGLWAMGLREPELSDIVLEYALALRA